MNERAMKKLQKLEERFRRTFATPLRSRDGVYGQTHIMIDRSDARAIVAALREIEDSLIGMSEGR